MSITPHFLLESERLSPYVNEFQKIFDETVGKIAKIIPVSSVDVVFCDNPKGAIPDFGVGGHTYNSHLVIISFDTSSPEFAEKIHIHLTKTLVHELHHALRWGKVGYGQNLLEALVTEGLACHFEHEICHQPPSPWCCALSDELLVHYLLMAKKEFYYDKYNHSCWFYGSVEKHFPKWVGYSLGYKIVADYLQLHPNQKPSTLYATPAKAFLSEKM